MTKKRKYLIMVAVVAIVVACDLVTKAIFEDANNIKVIPYLINFQTNGGNEGVAFGAMSGKKVLLIVIAIALILGLIIFDIFYKQKSLFYTIGFGFVMGGAVGNLVDRIWLGYVRDFIEFDFWKSFPIFNFADSFICIGVCLLCICVLKESFKEEK